MQWKVVFGRNISLANLKINDPVTKGPSTRNMYWQPKAGDFKVPGIGKVEIGINQLQDHGIMICVCNMAMTVLSAVAAQSMKMDAKLFTMIGNLACYRKYKLFLQVYGLGKSTRIWLCLLLCRLNIITGYGCLFVF